MHSVPGLSSFNMGSITDTDHVGNICLFLGTFLKRESLSLEPIVDIISLLWIHPTNIACCGIESKKANTKCAKEALTPVMAKYKCSFFRLVWK